MGFFCKLYRVYRFQHPLLPLSERLLGDDCVMQTMVFAYVQLHVVFVKDFLPYKQIMSYKQIIINDVKFRALAIACVVVVVWHFCTTKLNRK